MNREISATSPNDFDHFMGLFLASGKALNIADQIKAGNLWGALSPAERELAFEDARRQLSRTRHAQFVPLPANYLRDKPWTRVAMPRTLEYIDPKADAALDKHTEVVRIMEQRAARRAS